MTDLPPQRGRPGPAARRAGGDARPLAELPPEALLELLRSVSATADPVPLGVLDAARSSFTWRTVDSELAELAEDSALDALAGVRGAAGPRLLTFEAPAATVVVEVTSRGSAHRLLGQLVHPRAADIEVRHADGTSVVHADEWGRFRVETVPSGPVSLACSFSGHPARRVVTSWVTL